MQEPGPAVLAAGLVGVCSAKIETQAATLACRRTPSDKRHTRFSLDPISIENIEVVKIQH